MPLKELLRARAEKNELLQAIAAKEAEGTELTAEDLSEFDKLEAEIGDLNAKIGRAEKAQAAAAAAAQKSQPLKAAVVSAGAHVGGRDDSDPGISLAQSVVSLAAAKGDHALAAKIAEERFGVSMGPMDVKTPNSAGVLVHEQHSREMIELLKNRTVMRQIGARVVPMTNGNLTMGRKTGRGAAGYGPEGADAGLSKGTFGQTKLEAKKLTALTPVSNDLIRQATPEALELVRDDLVEVLQLEEDVTFLRAVGDTNTPTGLRHQITASNVVTSQGTSTATLAQVDATLQQIIGKVRRSNTPMTNPAWIMSSDVYTFLEGMRDGNGNLVYPSLMNGMLKCFPVTYTEQVPSNLGAGTNESEIYFGDASQLIIGDTLNLQIAVSTDATYKDGAELVSAFSRDQTVMRIISEHDFKMRHDNSWAVATGVQWGTR